VDDNRDVELRFGPVPGHVRTARLVAVAVARRALLDDLRLDEVRLAVGEACARAVRRCLSSGTPGPIILVLSDSVSDTSSGLRAEIWDDAPPAPAPVIDEPRPAGVSGGEGEEGADEETGDEVVIPLLAGLADHIEVLDGIGGPGGRVRLTWTHHGKPA
jgi:anti-sigma regulatory factor (Ser/Thr protein kinase)